MCSVVAVVFVSPTDGLNELKDTKRLSVNEICIRLETLVGTKQIIVAKLLHGVAAEFRVVLALFSDSY